VKLTKEAALQVAKGCDLVGTALRLLGRYVDGAIFLIRPGDDNGNDVARMYWVVDDDLDMCNQLSDYLGRNDFRVTALNTAKTDARLHRA